MPAFHVLNWTFIGFFQCVLLYSVTTPAYVMLLLAKQGNGHIAGVDYVLAGIMVSFVLISFIADQQQFSEPHFLPFFPSLAFLLALTPFP